jgi:hypothetical protein
VLKGKSDVVKAFRLLALREVSARRQGAPFVGRLDELELLQHAFARVAHERKCALFTLLGTAGVGKSRLVDEVLSRLARRGSFAAAASRTARGSRTTRSSKR